MKKKLQLILTIFLFSVCQTLHADVLVLVHGYLGDAGSWEKSGINEILDHHGWKRAGLFIGTPMGPQLLVTRTHARNQVYDTNMPSEMPVEAQAKILNQMLDQLQQREPNESIILVGHSAGGVVARAALVQQPRHHVKALITIASPHLGTYRAIQALNITRNQGPFELVKDFVGGNDYVALKHSRILLLDLLPARPGNFLGWLNIQPHPAIRYISVIRVNPEGIAGDALVPGYSQDMNNVPALKGRSAVYYTPTGHYLVPDDAFTLLQLLKTLQ